MCEANARLVRAYGLIGKVVGSLLTNVLAHTYSNKDAESFTVMQEAALQGRTNQDFSYM